MLELNCPHCFAFNLINSEILDSETIECEQCKKDIYHGLTVFNGEE